MYIATYATYKSDIENKIKVNVFINDVLKFFQESADDGHWDTREFAQIFFRKIIKANPEKAQKFLLKQVKSKSSNIRRFVSETFQLN